MLKHFLRTSNTFTGIFQLCFPFFIWWGIQLDAGWGWWVASFFFWGWVYTIIGNNITLHRYICHRHYTMNKPLEYFLLFIGCMVGVGEPVSYAMTHLVHHNPKYTDTNLDPHGPSCGMRSILMMFQRTVNPDITPIFSRRVLELKNQYEWLHRYYIPLFLSVATLLYLIDVKVFLFLWAIPASFACWGIGWAVYRQHLNLTPNNTPTANWEPTYEGLHKNHHDFPAAPNGGINKGEIDHTYQVSRIFTLFGLKYNWQGQPNHD